MRASRGRPRRRGFRPAPLRSPPCSSFAPPVGPLRGVVPLVIAVGVFDTTANILLALASTRDLISIVATPSSLYPVTTVVLAVALLGERPKRSQGGGGALALAGATMIAV